MDIGLQVLLELNGTSCSFESAEQLLEDFFNEVTIKNTERCHGFKR